MYLTEAALYTHINYNYNYYEYINYKRFAIRSWFYFSSEHRHRKIRYNLKAAIKKRDRIRLPPAVGQFKAAKLPDDDHDLPKAERILKEFKVADSEFRRKSIFYDVVVISNVGVCGQQYSGSVVSHGLPSVIPYPVPRSARLPRRPAPGDDDAPVVCPVCHPVSPPSHTDLRRAMTMRQSSVLSVTLSPPLSHRPAPGDDDAPVVCPACHPVSPSPTQTCAGR